MAIVPSAMAQTASRPMPSATPTITAAPVASEAPAPMPAATPTPGVAPTSAVTPSQAPAPPLAASTYRINPGDELEIYVWGEERLQRTVKVLPDGTLAFPLIGQIMVQGMLPRDLERTVSDRLRDQYRGQVPQVTVSIKSASGLQFSVMGKVKAPGTYSPGRYTNLLEALSLAGGPAEFANLDAVVILRKRGNTTTPLKYKLGSLFKSGSGNADAAQVNIEPGDMIIVP